MAETLIQLSHEPVYLSDKQKDCKACSKAGRVHRVWVWKMLAELCNNNLIGRKERQ